jgi:hypothetical protein
MYYILTIELNKKLPKKRWKILKGLNPKRKRGTPVTQCIILTNENTVKMCKKGDFSWSKSYWTKRATRVLEDLSKKFETKIDVYRYREETVTKMRDLGWRVYFENPRNRRVYIIELDKKAWGFKGFKKANGGELTDWKKLLYIGETKETVRERYAIHKRKVNGKKDPLAATIVFKHGTEIAESLMREFENEEYTQLEALEKEREIGLHFREIGFATWFN